MYFEYDESDIHYLMEKAPVLGEVIRQIGPVKRAVTPDLFAALVSSIVGQQISTKAADTVRQRLKVLVQEITPERILSFSDEELQSVGMSYRKVTYIKNSAEKIVSGEIAIERLHEWSDEEVKKELTKLKGVGEWTAEMLMIFSMQRRNILSFDDLGIQRGLRMLYHHRRITPQLFRKYHRRYTPVASIASLYLWEIVSGAVPRMKDYAPLSEAEKKRRAKERRRRKK